MGFMTNITLLNDHFDWVLKNPKKFVWAIQAGMNDGIIGEAYDLQRGRAPYESDEEREARIHYVTVHQAKHADEPQVIYCNRNSTFPIHDLPYAIDMGWLQNKYGEPKYAIKHLRSAVSDLRRMADRLEEALDKQEKHELRKGKV